ncbi:MULTISPECIES: hypothetical protein [Actinomadura]|uniref:DUF3592 domain-containing protein n=1 Tax=Actinomadura yumaensis TaxID=111807 RepID=A0ABW2CFN3_9ACTN|nr:hypothetical protein [Actinomadura sp. J1-007]MWK38415.1 hypothetical protein [Actinomadura sp. J1-007]
MRALLSVLALLGTLGVVVFGGIFTLVGYLEQRRAHPPYKIEFVHGRGGCDEGPVHLNVEDGKQLSCIPSRFAGGWGYEGELPGFTAEQTDEVMALSESLGADGLSDADQRQIQQRVDQIAATVPPAQRPHRPTIWGARRAWLGIGMIAVAITPAWMLLRRV